MPMWDWIKQRSGPTLTLLLLIAAGVLILVALVGSTKIKALAAIDLLPL